MTAVASPLSSFQANSRWNPNGNPFGAMDSDEISRMFDPGPRKTIQRQNSNSSIASSTSSTSSTSTITTTTAIQPNGIGQPVAEAGSWAARKKPPRVIWPPGKAEPATGISTARPQAVNSLTSVPTASSAISALHAPLLPQQDMPNGNPQANGAIRHVVPPLPPPPVLLHLSPINGTFERKTITVPYGPDMLRIGRQTNQKTIPTPVNGYFDSKVLSRQHAEIYADRQGRIYIRDIKSSNGTFVNGMRLSQENKESEPRELREGDMLELGIDIVSEDQKTVVHHKVAAKVEHAGIYGQSPDIFNFNDLESGAGAGLLLRQPLKPNGNQGLMNGRPPPIAPPMQQPPMGMGPMNPPAQNVRNWLNPITTEHVVKKLNAEMKLAMQQSHEIARARQSIEALLGTKLESPTKEPRSGSERMRLSPTRARSDLKSALSHPPAPPPQAPLPEKPDVARALADPVIEPLLRRNDPSRSPPSAGSSPTRTDHSSDILKLCEELKLAKGELTSQNERLKTLEDELTQERSARESAEERVLQLEQSKRRDSPTDEDLPKAGVAVESPPVDTSAELHTQLSQLQASMDEMKMQVEVFRQRAEIAEAERDEVRQSLAEMVEQKRIENEEHERTEMKRKSRSKSRSRRSPNKTSLPPTGPGMEHSEPNGVPVAPIAPLGSPTSESLLERAGIEGGQPITPEQAQILTQYLAQEVLGPHNKIQSPDVEQALLYYGLPYGSFAAVVLLGYIAMTWVNGWPKTER